MSKLLNEHEVAELLKVSVHTLRDWRYARGSEKQLKHVKIGRLVRYEEREIMKYLERRRSA